MKRLQLLAALLLCSLLTYAQFSGSGSGTENDPYLILNPIQLNQMRNFLNQDGVYFKLMADIDLTDFLEDENPTQGWQPVGTSSAPFKGILDGNGHTVSGLRISRSNNDYVGLWGYTHSAIIKNFTIKGINIHGKDNTGGLIGYGYNTTITTCSVHGSVNGNSNVGSCVGAGEKLVLTNITSWTNVDGGDYTGGIIGQTTKGINVSDCIIHEESIIKGDNYVGGICGSSTGADNQYIRCFVNSIIIGHDYTGGVCGKTEYHTNIINACGFVGEISANSNVGGIAGEYSQGSSYSKYNHPHPTLINSFVTGNIVAKGDNVGGIVGTTDADKDYTGPLGSSYYVYYVNEIAFCYFSGSIQGNSFVGGIVGQKKGGGVISCYSKATITGNESIGGICGNIDYFGVAKLKSNIANITQINGNSGNIGRIYGHKGDFVEIGALGSSEENKAYNRAIFIKAGVAQDVADDEQNGAGVSRTTLKLKATYVAMGWDFTDTWAIQETECYPYFQWQTAPPVITSQVVSGATVVSGKCIDGGLITLEVDGVKQQMASTGNQFSFTVSPLQAGHEVRVSAKAEGKEQSYFATEVVSYLGKGTEADPYQIYTAADLTGVYRKGYFKLMNDIDLTDYINQFSPVEGWQSIGREGSETIHLDGDGHKITGLWCNSTRDNTGLFSCFANGTIKNLNVETANGKQVKGGANTGILIGKMINGKIENCKVSGIVADGTPVGGMVGLFDGGSIVKCQATITISTTDATSYVGGLIGEMTGGQIDQCVTLGSMKATGTESYVGGLVGKNSATVTNCYSNAQVTSSYNAAGLIAYNYGLVEKCYATGDLYSNNYAAGVIGYNDGANAVVRNCAAMNNKIEVTYESQSAQSGGYGQRIIGGIKNNAPAPELNNYALKTMQVSVNDVPQRVYDDIMNGVAKAGADLMSARTYQELGWDFSSIWKIQEAESYPSLINNEAGVGGAGNEPEPIVTSDDVLSVTDVTGFADETVSIGINLKNKSSDLTAYQFDLIMPAGITLAKDGRNKIQVTKTGRYEDDAQSLTISPLTDNSYRIICFSLSNGLIEGNDGAILNAILSIADDVAAGTYECTISNIIFTKVEGGQIKLPDTKFNVIVSDVIMGDANGDKEVNVSDIVEIVNYILEKPSSRFVLAASDLNGDGEINVTDIVRVVAIILSVNASNVRSNYLVNTEESKGSDELALIGLNPQTYALHLDNSSDFVAAQFDVHLNDGQSIENIIMNSVRNSGHHLAYSEIANGVYRVIVYSTDNSSFYGNSGELVTLRMNGVGNLMIDNIVFVTSGMSEAHFAPLFKNATGIFSTEVDKANTIYSIDGVRIKHYTQGLPKGLYIVNGKKLLVK